jgi:hypothetical protein
VLRKDAEAFSRSASDIVSQFAPPLDLPRPSWAQHTLHLLRIIWPPERDSHAVPQHQPPAQMPNLSRREAACSRTTRQIMPGTPWYVIDVLFPRTSESVSGQI